MRLKGTNFRPPLKSVTAQLQQAVNNWGPFDIVIDDGSHISQHQIKTFEYCFIHCVKPGGLYIVEDLQTSFYGPPHWGSTPQAQDARQTMAQYLSDLQLSLHFPFWNERVQPGSFFYKPAFVIHELSSLWTRTLDCDREICAIRKRRKPFPCFFIRDVQDLYPKVSDPHKLQQPLCEGQSQTVSQALERNPDIVTKENIEAWYA